MFMNRGVKYNPLLLLIQFTENVEWHKINIKDNLLNGSSSESIDTTLCKKPEILY
ncbi:MAG: hypothetical protein LBF12_01330 [Christensenellaceae bacterium]|nr:hypothetical protein [Christensenellaceae bacterium]